MSTSDRMCLGEGSFCPLIARPHGYPRARGGMRRKECGTAVNSWNK